MEPYELIEAVPNFSEGRDTDRMAAIAEAASGAHVIDSDSDPDHNRSVLSIIGGQAVLGGALFAAVAQAVESLDLRAHSGLHPRVGVADVVPCVPLANSTFDRCRTLASELGERIWNELHVPVYYYGPGKTLADIRAGRVKPDLGGPAHHPTAGAVCVGARLPLVAFNVLLRDTDLAKARALARSLRESKGGLRGVQALIFELPGKRIQLSTNLFRLDEVGPQALIDTLNRMGVAFGDQQVVGLCPVAVANEAATGRLLEARIAGAAAAAGAARCTARDTNEMLALAKRLSIVAKSFAEMGADQASLRAGAERSIALVAVLRAAGVLDNELSEMLSFSARGFRKALTPETISRFPARLQALARQVKPDPS